MAGGTISGTTNNDGISSKIVWSSVTDVDANTSTVTATLYYKRLNNYTTYGTGSFTLAIGSTEKTESNYIILDVRTPEEFAEKHIPHAINIPNETIGTAEIPELPDKEQLMNNMYWYISQLIDRWGGSATLLILGCVFGGMTLLKTSCFQQTKWLINSVLRLAVIRLQLCKALRSN